MNELILNILSVVVSTVVLPLISICGTYLIKWINAQIKDQKYAKLLSDATNIVLNAVRSVSQTYVDSLKSSGSFGKEAQEVALSKAKEIALSQMGSELKTFVEENFGNVESWLTNQIESSINIIKKE